MSIVRVIRVVRGIEFANIFLRVRRSTNIEYYCGMVAMNGSSLKVVGLIGVVGLAGSVGL